MSKISPFLWFDGNAEEAVNLYTSIFTDSKVNSISRYGDAGPGPSGSVMVATFELFGQTFTALNGGPAHKFTPAVSLYVDCENQAEVDEYWSKLLAGGGREDNCGWLQDKFGLSWQIIPKALPRLLSSPDRTKANRVMQAMLKMKKIDVAELEAAAVAHVSEMPATRKTLTITTPGEREIHLTRTFNAPRRLLFEAHTKPELLRRWMGVMPGWTLATCEFDARKGGKYRYVLKGPDGAEMGFGGKIVEFDPPKRIVSTELFDEDWTGGETLVTLAFDEKDGKTTLRMTILYASEKARDGALAIGMTDGMELGYASLDEVLAERT